MQSSNTGAENGFRISVADDDGSDTDALGLSRIAFDPPSATGQMALTQSATNAQATINGIAVTTAGNTLTGVVDGITFTLNKVTTTPTIVSVASDTAAVKNLMTGFVTAFNELASFLNSATRFDASTKSGALLQGDALTTGLQTQLRSLIGQPGSTSSKFKTLSDIGIEFQKDGTLKVNDTKLAAAMTNLSDLRSAMSTVDPVDSTKNGFGKRLASWAEGLLATDGRLPGKTKSIQSQIASNRKDQDKFGDRLEQIEKRLRAQYTALDTTMSKANALQAYVNQQITTWNKSTA